MQEQNAQREEEKAKLVKDMDQVKEQNEKLKQTLQMQMKENDRLKVCHQFIMKPQPKCQDGREKKLTLKLLLLC